MNRTILVSILLNVLPYLGFSQEISNLRAVATGNVVNIYYDLHGSMDGQVFEVSVYSSHNNMEEPLKFVRGDIGADINPGTDKRIEWGAKKELSAYDGELVFEVQARLTFSPIAFQQLPANTVYRRGKMYPLEWKGGVEGEALQLELWQDGKKLSDIRQIANQGKYTWQVPMSIKPGKNYSVRVSSYSNTDNFSESSPFMVKRKIPTALKVVPAGIALGVATVFLINSASGPDPVPRTRLPAPPDPE